MNTCRNCNCITCPGQGTDEIACRHYGNDEPQFEAYTFNERTGSENIHFFHTAEARDAFVARQPSWKMAH